MIRKAATLWTFFLALAIPALLQAQNLSRDQYHAIEGAGLYDSTSDQSLGRDLWFDSKRSHLTELIPLIPADLDIPFLNKLALQVLLSSTNTRLIQDDQDIVAGEDLLTLRLEKLIELGAYNAAAKLYSQFEEPAYHPRLAKAGLLALLLSNQKAVACLEARILNNRFSDDAFIKEFRAYCTIYSESTSDEERKGAREVLIASESVTLKKIAENKNYRVNYNEQSLAALPPIELAYLAGDGRINFENLSLEDIRSLNKRFIIMLLNKTDLSDSEKLTATIRAFEYGFRSSYDIANFYRDTYRVYKDRGGSDTDLPNLIYTQLSVHYSLAKNEDDPEKRWSHIQKALAIESLYGEESLAPFAPLMAGILHSDIEITDLFKVLSVFHKSRFDVPFQWFERLEKLNFEEWKGNKSYKNAYTVAFLSLPDHHKTDERKARFKNLWVKGKNKVSEKDTNKFDIIINPVLYQELIYENVLGLTLTSDYVMPNEHLWERLHYASRNAVIGEVALINIIYLHLWAKNANKFDFDYDFFAAMFESLNAVGLKNVLRDVKIHILLEQ